MKIPERHSASDLSREKRESAHWNMSQSTHFHWRNRKENGPRKTKRALDLRDTIKCSNVCIMGVPYEQKRKRQKEFKNNGELWLVLLSG